MSIDADRLNEIREGAKTRGMSTASHGGQVWWGPTWDDVRGLLAALDDAEQRAAELKEYGTIKQRRAAEQRAVQAEQERDEALRLSDDLVRRGQAAEARLAETQEALRQIADGEVRQVNAARHARVALTTHPEAKP